MKDPAILFYTSDFLGGVSDLTMEERGQYITLLCLQHQKGILTEKTIRLSVGLVSVDVLKKFHKNLEGEYYNERLKLETEKRAKFLDSRRINGSKGGRPKQNLEKPLGYPTDNLIENININEYRKGGVGEKQSENENLEKGIEVVKSALNKINNEIVNSYINDKTIDDTKLPEWFSRFCRNYPNINRIDIHESFRRFCRDILSTEQHLEIHRTKIEAEIKRHFINKFNKENRK